MPFPATFPWGLKRGSLGAEDWRGDRMQARETGGEVCPRPPDRGGHEAPGCREVPRAGRADSYPGLPAPPGFSLSLPLPYSPFF